MDLGIDDEAPFWVTVKDGSGTTEGALFCGTGYPGDMVEGFVLALACAGFPVHAPEFKECLRNYGDVVFRCSSDLAEEADGMEEAERILASRHVEVFFAEEEDGWGVGCSWSNSLGEALAARFPKNHRWGRRTEAVAEVRAWLDEQKQA